MHANASLGKMIQYMPLNDARIAAHWRWLADITEQERLEKTVPVLEGPDSYDILVVGADRAKTLIMPTGSRSVTEGVDQYRP